MSASSWSAVAALAIAGLTVSPASSEKKDPAPTDNAEMSRMYREDQADRQKAIQEMDWTVVKPRDDARLKRTRELYAAGALRTGADWLHAAMILQHGNDAEDFLLAHEMCIAAMALGDPSAKGLVTATEDRFLRRIGRKQRFGTQYEPASEPGTFQLAPTDPEVTDGLRAVLGVHSLAEAKAMESVYNRKK